jgi:hypothetical protein
VSKCPVVLDPGVPVRVVHKSEPTRA